MHGDDEQIHSSTTIYVMCLPVFATVKRLSRTIHLGTMLSPVANNSFSHVVHQPVIVAIKFHSQNQTSAHIVPTVEKKVRRSGAKPLKL